MKDIQVDDNGDMRCAYCGGKHFQDRRTTSAHVVGFVTVGVGALATRKKLRCKLCGAYNKQGNAQPFVPQDANAAAGTPPTRASAPENKERSDGELLVSTVMLCGFALFGLVWAMSSGSTGWTITCAILLAVFGLMLGATIYESSASTKPKKEQPRSTGPVKAVVRTNDPAFQIKKKHR